MTVTDSLIIGLWNGFLNGKTGDVLSLIPYKLCFDEWYSPPWISFKMSVGKEKSSYQVTEILYSDESRIFIPRTALGKKLMLLRKRAIVSGMRLLNEDEVLEEVKRRRGEFKYDKTDIY